MKPRLKLYLKKNIYDHKNTDTLFLNSVKANIQYHHRHCQEYHAILEGMNFSTDELNSIESLNQLPFITTLYLKTHHPASMKSWRLPVKATSSGTSGMKSQIGYNMKSLLYAGIMTIKMASYHNLFSGKRTNYIMLGYEPQKMNQTLIVKTQAITSLLAPPKSKKYALKFNGKDYEADYEGIKYALKEYSQDKAPVRLIGYPAFTLFLLDALEKENISYVLPKDSMVLLGGGWKGAYQEPVDKETLYDRLYQTLGISKDRCHEFFGVTEHPVLYCSCPRNHFHVPNFSRVIIRNAVTLKPVQNGEIGLVNLISPAADSMPLTSIMTDDLGILHDGHTCGCGITTPYLEIVGRAGMKEIQTCAINSTELLKGVK